MNFRRTLRPCAGGRAVQLLETMRCRKDGRQIHVSLSVSPIFDEVGKVIGVAKAIARDITERKARRAGVAGRIRALCPVNRRCAHRAHRDPR